MVEIKYLEINNILNKLREGKFQDASYFKLNYIANQLQLKGKREELMTLDELKDKINLYPHQINAALKFLNEMEGRIILADEVGLGKTIEAGIILKELIARDENTKKMLILTPASLQLQWQVEMLEKFGLHFEVNKSVHHWSNYNKIIASIDTAKKQKHIEEIESIKWDILIVDEAHKLKNSSTKAYKSFQKIIATNKLFLTATPIQNNLMEIYNIIDLLDNGYLGTPYDFKRLFIADNKGLEISNKDRLKEMLQGIMVRSTRKGTGLEFTQRKVSSVFIKQTDDEEKFMDVAFDFIRGEYKEKSENEEGLLKGVGTLLLMGLARMLCSCRYAFSLSFKNYIDKHVKDPIQKERAIEILDINEKLKENKKFLKTIELVKMIKSKVIIFTQFRATQSALEDYLRKEGFKTDKINGSMTPKEKQYAIRNLKVGMCDVLISTEAGSEGLNLQFCHNLINYDLPWNPMKVEQRIGRIHRIGQEYDVKIYNLAIKETIEEYILQRLYKKIELFHLAIGEMGDIISRVVDEESFDKTVFEILIKSSKKIDIKKKMNELFDKIKQSKKFQEDIEKLDKKTLSVFDLAPIKDE